MCEWNGLGAQTSYGGDDATALATKQLAAVFETEVRASFDMFSARIHASSRICVEALPLSAAHSFALVARSLAHSCIHTMNRWIFSCFYRHSRACADALVLSAHQLNSSQ